MHDWILHNELQLRLAAFAAVLVIMLLWETLAPFRVATVSLLRHRLNNLLLVFIDTAFVRLVLLSFAAVACAQWAAENQWGLFNHVSLPLWLEYLAGFFLLDMAIYFQHRVFHAVPLLWRLHRVHHSDPDYDTTTGVRFHPLEILLSMLIKFVIILAVGPAALVVLVFEIVLSVSSLFNHGNVQLPMWLEPVVRALIVTPDMHRVHHSPEREETDSNFGFFLSCWDRMFGTYRKKQSAGVGKVNIGLHGFDESNSVELGALLLQPFSSPDGIRGRQT